MIFFHILRVDITSLECPATGKNKSQKRTKYSAINHLIHFLNTYMVVVAAQHAYYSSGEPDYD